MGGEITLLCVLVILFAIADIFIAADMRWVGTRCIGTLLVLYVALHPKTDEMWAIALLLADLAFLFIAVLNNLRLGNEVDV